jgi:hypothetical protein
MHLDLHLTEGTELRAHSRVDEAGRPFAEICWDFHGPLPDSCGNGLWGTTTAMRRLAELILQAARLAEEEAAWQAHTDAPAATSKGSRVA